MGLHKAADAFISAVCGDLGSGTRLLAADQNLISDTDLRGILCADLCGILCADLCGILCADLCVVTFTAEEHNNEP